MTSAKQLSQKEIQQNKREATRCRQNTHRKTQAEKGLNYIYLSVTSEAFNLLRKIKVAGGFRNLHEAAAACIAAQCELSPKFEPRTENHTPGVNNYPFWLPEKQHSALTSQTEYQTTSIALSAYIEANAVHYGV